MSAHERPAEIIFPGFHERAVIDPANPLVWLEKRLWGEEGGRMSSGERRRIELRVGRVGLGFRERHVVVTGGVGALGRAVVGALLAAAPNAMYPIGRSGRRKAFPAER